MIIASFQTCYLNNPLTMCGWQSLALSSFLVLTVLRRGQSRWHTSGRLECPSAVTSGQSAAIVLKQQGDGCCCCCCTKPNPRPSSCRPPAYEKQTDEQISSTGIKRYVLKMLCILCRVGRLAHSFITTHTSTVPLCLLCDSRATGVILRLFRLLQLGSHSTPTYSGSAFHAAATGMLHAHSASVHMSLTAQMSLFLVKCCQFPSPPPLPLNTHVWLIYVFLSLLSKWVADDDLHWCHMGVVP